MSLPRLHKKQQNRLSEPPPTSLLRLKTEREFSSAPELRRHMLCHHHHHVESPRRRRGVPCFFCRKVGSKNVVHPTTTTTTTTTLAVTLAAHKRKRDRRKNRMRQYSKTKPPLGGTDEITPLPTPPPDEIGSFLDYGAWLQQLHVLERYPQQQEHQFSVATGEKLPPLTQTLLTTALRELKQMLFERSLFLQHFQRLYHQPLFSDTTLKK